MSYHQFIIYVFAYESVQQHDWFTYFMIWLLIVFLGETTIIFEIMEFYGLLWGVIDCDVSIWLLT